jgi:hypothetical protein
MEPTGPVAVLELRFRGRIQWPPATNPIAIGTTPASVSASRNSRQPRKTKTCSCRWPRRGGDWRNKRRARESRTRIEWVSPNEPGGYSQQHSTGPGRQNPKISVPTPDDRRCRQAIFWISYSLGEPIQYCRYASGQSARDPLSRAFTSAAIDPAWAGSNSLLLPSRLKTVLPPAVGIQRPLQP